MLRLRFGPGPLLRSTLGPLTLLPAARSPGRPHCCGPPAGSYPAVSALTSAPEGALAGMLSVAVVVTRTFPSGRPHLRFHGAAFPAPRGGRVGVGKFLPDGRCQGGGGSPASSPYSNAWSGWCQKHSPMLLVVEPTRPLTPIRRSCATLPHPPAPLCPGACGSHCCAGTCS